MLGREEERLSHERNGLDEGVNAGRRKFMESVGQ